MGFFGIKMESPNENAKPVRLEKEYEFMHEGFILSSQRKLYLLLKENNATIEALRFDFKIYQFGYPNDEVGLPSKTPGVALYAFSEVFNSNWIKRLKKNNRSHSSHSDDLYRDDKHYIIRFKEVTLEVIAPKFQIVQLTRKEIDDFLDREIGFLTVTPRS
ncbi:hypothetical protein [Flavobacterium sp.]|uniref:hypothetical protein n=1 Tax=Flavobacterium sp. TaxID=239 RepID=UPI0039E29E87